MTVRSLKLLGGGAVRGSEGHPAAADDLASEKGHLLAKKGTFSTITPGGGQLPPPAPPPLGTALTLDPRTATAGPPQLNSRYS